MATDVRASRTLTAGLSANSPGIRPPVSVGRGAGPSATPFWKKLKRHIVALRSASRGAVATRPRSVACQCAEGPLALVTRSRRALPARARARAPRAERQSRRRVRNRYRRRTGAAAGRSRKTCRPPKTPIRRPTRRCGAAIQKRRRARARTVKRPRRENEAPDGVRARTSRPSHTVALAPRPAQTPTAALTGLTGRTPEGVAFALSVGNPWPPAPPRNTTCARVSSRARERGKGAQRVARARPRARSPPNSTVDRTRAPTAAKR